HGVAGKVTLKMRLVDRHVLDTNAVLVTANVDYAIDPQERIPVRQHLEPHVDVRRLKLSHGFVHGAGLICRPCLRPSGARAAQVSPFRETIASKASPAYRPNAPRRAHRRELR